MVCARAIHWSESGIICQCQEGGDSEYGHSSFSMVERGQLHSPSGWVDEVQLGAAHTGDTNPPFMLWELQQKTQIRILSDKAVRHNYGPAISLSSRTWDHRQFLYRFRDRDQINWGEKGHFSGGALGKRPDLINEATHGIICKRRCHNGYHSCSFKSFIGFTRSQIDDFSPGAKTPAISVMRDIKAGMGTRRDQRKYEGSDVMCLFYELIKLDGRFLRWSKINNRGSRDH